MFRSCSFEAFSLWPFYDFKTAYCCRRGYGSQSKDSIPLWMKVIGYASSTSTRQMVQATTELDVVKYIFLLQATTINNNTRSWTTNADAQPYNFCELSTPQVTAALHDKRTDPCCEIVPKLLVAALCDEHTVRNTMCILSLRFDFTHQQGIGVSYIKTRSSRKVK